jgi:hypothetical protein
MTLSLVVTAFLVALAPVTGIYLPGVAPQDYAVVRLTSRVTRQCSHQRLQQR